MGNMENSRGAAILGGKPASELAFFTLLVSQGFHRIHASGPARREVSSRQGGQRQRRDCADQNIAGRSATVQPEWASVKRMPSAAMRSM